MDSFCPEYLCVLCIFYILGNIYTLNPSLGPNNPNIATIMTNSDGGCRGRGKYFPQIFPSPIPIFPPGRSYKYLSLRGNFEIRNSLLKIIALLTFLFQVNIHPCTKLDKERCIK